MSLDLDWDEGQHAILDSLTSLVRAWSGGDPESAGTLPRSLWSELGELGAFSVGTPEGDGGPLEAVVVAEVLGNAAVSGPIAETFFATQVLPEGERRSVACGQAVVSVGVGPSLPWVQDADLFILREVGMGDAGRAWLTTPPESIDLVESLGGETWGRGDWPRGVRLENVSQGHRMAELVHAAYMAAAGSRLVSDAAQYAQTREQFGRPLGSFQAVSHPLADCYMRLASATTLARAAAAALSSEGTSAAQTWIAAARLSADAAALEAVHVCHQVFGAIGITTEGPIFHVTRRIRQMASTLPGGAAAKAALLAHFEREEGSHDD